MSKMLVSIVIPVYNAEKYLARCIQSVLSQTFNDFELILVNDGSEDSSLSICDKYKLTDERIKVYSQDNGGVSSARNFGITKASGTWVCFIDADDTVGEKYLESFVYKGLSDTHLIIQDIIKENINNKTRSYLKARSYGKFRVQELDEHLSRQDIYLLGFAVCKLYNLDLIKREKLIFNVNIKYFEDLLFYLSYLKHIEIIQFIDEAHYVYNIHDESARSKTYSFDHYLSVIHEMSKALEELVRIEKWGDCLQIKDMLGMFHFLALLAVFKKKNKYTYQERLSKLSILAHQKYFQYIEDYIVRRRTKHIELLIIKMLKRNNLKSAELILRPYFRVYDYFLRLR